MFPSEIFEPLRQREEGDCAITAMAMLLGLPYTKVADAARKVSPNALKKGLWTKQILQIVKKLSGKELKSKAVTFDSSLEESTGLLILAPHKRKGSYHVVILMRGLLWDPDSALLYAHPEVFYASAKYRPVRFLAF